MKRTDQTLMEQMKSTPNEIARRKELLAFDDKDAKFLSGLKGIVTDNIEQVVQLFYQQILSFDDIDRIIGDAESLERLRKYQRQYILTLFDGQYDEEYVHSRLRVGMVHRRIGLEPRYYLAAVHHLKSILRQILIQGFEKDCTVCNNSLTALDKIIMFDLSLIVDTYITSLMEETRRSREEVSEYAQSLEETIARRTQRLKDLARNDGLTGLLNQSAFYGELRRELARSSRLNHCVVLLYFDLDGFKNLNDTRGHKAGDDVLVKVAAAVGQVTRQNEITARYGGDEFCIILPESLVEQGLIVGKRLCEAIEKGVKGTHVTCSIGIASSTPDHPLDADSLVRLADAAMYKAKTRKGFSMEVAADTKVQ
jgi:diguanylate cyclase (GGDEF)-like protein